MNACKKDKRKNLGHSYQSQGDSVIRTTSTSWGSRDCRKKCWKKEIQRIQLATQTKSPATHSCLWTTAPKHRLHKVWEIKYWTKVGRLVTNELIYEQSLTLKIGPNVRKAFSTLRFIPICWLCGTLTSVHKRCLLKKINYYYIITVCKRISLFPWCP